MGTQISRGGGGVIIPMASHPVVAVSNQQGVIARIPKFRPLAVPVSSAPYPCSTPQSYLTNNKQPINDDLLERFLVVQAEISEHNSEGVFEGLQTVQLEFEALLNEKKQAEVNYRVLKEQHYDNLKQDYDNITSPTVQAYFSSKQGHERAIAKEKFVYLESVKNVEKAMEKAEGEMRKVSEKYEKSLDKYNEYQRDNKKAIDLLNEQMNILCKFCWVGLVFGGFESFGVLKFGRFCFLSVSNF